MKSNTKASKKSLDTVSVEKSTRDGGERDPQMQVKNVSNGLGQDTNCPHCGGTIKPIDSFADSQTVQCMRCERCALVKSSLMIREVIPLVDFHLRWGAGMDGSLHDLSKAENLVEDLINGRWPSIATVVDFGIESSAHFGALQSAYRGGWNVYDLDRVLGDGRAITQLIRAVPEQRYPDVVFCTLEDDFRSLSGLKGWLWNDV